MLPACRLYVASWTSQCKMQLHAAMNGDATARTCTPRTSSAGSAPAVRMGSNWDTQGLILCAHMDGCRSTDMGGSLHDEQASSRSPQLPSQNQTDESNC